MANKKKHFSAFLLAVFCLLSCVSTAYADGSIASYEWQDKLGRGVLNMVGSPVELARTVHIQSRAKGAGYGWTMGIVEGLGRTFLRFGAGAIETLTFPFDFPKDDKSPLLVPDYPWEKWDVQYL